MKRRTSNKPSKPSRKDIALEIQWLTENKSRIRRYTPFGFGDDNWEAIDCELAVLRGEIATEDGLYDGDWSGEAQDAGMAIFEWLAYGNHEKRPSESWGPLVKKFVGEER